MVIGSPHRKGRTDLCVALLFAPAALGVVDHAVALVVFDSLVRQQASEGASSGLTRTRAPCTPNSMGRALLTFVALWMLLTFAASCDGDRQRDCSNRACSCPEGHDCEISCHAPPCNVTCEQGSRCEATCANGMCTCQEGASCDFACKAPPCHVRCAGQHDRCDGTCANGTCACGPDSSCAFVCESGPCHVECPAGARCVVLCPHAPAGTQDCDIVRCAAGSPTLCPGLGATTCNAECPVTSDASH